ncbi:hypothetical protein LOC68_14950 [Blastopirellula sp. JC732]|uniref:Uncharacterized protein n=1 Tax=Blastopirellula sediminis TaxID=2894196 RepID=A0A9X1MQE2_9BACT|nr:hypothetical protein [Blastopirellula sediminis]MCC9607018.1 hypothetical protein [Blastopirellula sediminis]MCC9629689.1 hypothetical protein [Blastopirellula sediminis]
MRRGISILGLTVMLSLLIGGGAFAQEVRVLPGPHALPNGLSDYMHFLARQQLDSLRLFSDYMEQRAKENQVPRGLYLNAKAMQLQAELASAEDPALKKELLTEMAKLYDERLKLDANTPNQTWYGVDRVKLGDYMKREYQLFEQQAAEQANKPAKPAKPAAKK